MPFLIEVPPKGHQIIDRQPGSESLVTCKFGPRCRSLLYSSAGGVAKIRGTRRGAPGGGAVEASEAEWSTEGQAGLRARRRAWPSVPTGLVPLIQVVLVDQSRVALMIAQRPRRGDRLITSSRPRKARSASELGDGPALPYRSASCQSFGSFWSTRAVGLW